MLNRNIVDFAWTELKQVINGEIKMSDWFFQTWMRLLIYVKVGKTGIKHAWWWDKDNEFHCILLCIHCWKYSSYNVGTGKEFPFLLFEKNEVFHVVDRFLNRWLFIKNKNGCSVCCYFCIFAALLSLQDSEKIFNHTDTWWQYANKDLILSYTLKTQGRLF